MVVDSASNSTVWSCACLLDEAPRVIGLENQLGQHYADIAFSVYDSRPIILPVFNLQSVPEVPLQLCSKNPCWDILWSVRFNFVFLIGQKTLIALILINAVLHSAHWAHLLSTFRCSMFCLLRISDDSRPISSRLIWVIRVIFLPKEIPCVVKSIMCYVILINVFPLWNWNC